MERTRAMVGTLVLAVASWSAGCGGDDDAADAAVDGLSSRDGAAVSDAGGTDDGGGGGVDGAVAEDGGGGGVDAGPLEGCAAHAGALFCEDFEALAPGAPDTTRWSQLANNGMLNVDGDHARGSRALHVHTTDNGYAFMRLAFAPPGNSYFGRMYLYVTEFPSAPDWAHYTLVEARGTGSGDRVRPVGGQYAPTSSGAFWGIGDDGGPTGDWTNWRTSAPSEAGRWLCVEWEMDATNNFIRLSFDGVDNDDLTVDTTHHGGNDVDFVFPMFDDLKIGWQLYQGGTTPHEFDLWIDDVVLDVTRVGC